MALKKIRIIFFLFFYLLLGCTGGLIYTSDGTLMNQKKFLRQQLEYAPYKKLNSIEGFNKFISTYPKNIFIERAEKEIKRLEFEPYLEQNTIESYLEFKVLYPENPLVETADNRIEQSEIKRYEKMDTIEGYRDFLKKYPDSLFSILPKKRLQELEFRKFGKDIEQNYGFDLLLYRLKAKRLKKRLAMGGRTNLEDFTIFASFLNKNNKKYFHTYIIHPNKSSIHDDAAKEIIEKHFGEILSELLTHLDKKFGAKNKIDGYSFDISYSPHLFYGDRKIFFELFCSQKDTSRFTQKKLGLKQLLANSTINRPAEEKIAAAKPLKKSQANRKVAAPTPKDGLQIMTLVKERDRGRDHILSRSFKTLLNTGEERIRKTIEKRVNFKGNKDFTHKMVTRNLKRFKFKIADRHTIAVLSWHYKTGIITRWKKYRRRDPVRAKSGDLWTPPQETYFCYNDLGIGLSEEKHEFLKLETLENKEYYVVKSFPVKKERKYSKRLIWVDPESLTPIKYEYYDKHNHLWQTIEIKWQNKFGKWFWKNAEIINVRNKNRTLVAIDDVRVDVGLPARNFMVNSLRTLN